MAIEKNQPNREKRKYPKSNTQKNDRNVIKKLINISIMQVSFMYILKTSSIKSIKNSATTIANIADRNAGMRNVLNCQITSIRKMSAKLCKFFSNFCKIFLERFVWTLDVGKFRTITLNIAKAHILLVTKETSDVLSSNIVQNG